MVDAYLCPNPYNTDSEPNVHYRLCLIKHKAILREVEVYERGEKKGTQQFNFL